MTLKINPVNQKRLAGCSISLDDGTSPHYDRNKSSILGQFECFMVNLSE